MGVAGGPNIERDGLVFGYDTGYPIVSGSSDTYRFNLGEPTTNKLNGDIIGTGNGASLGSDAFGDYIQLADITSSYSRLQLPNIPVSSDETYTWSFELFTTETFTQSGNYSFDTNEYSEQFPTSNDLSRLSSSEVRPNTIPANTWTKFSLTVTMKSGLTGAYTYDFFNFFYPTFQNKKVYYRNMQFETKSHQTPYAGQGITRSASGSLLDLKGNTDIDLSNVSFDSNAQMTFDGTDDYIAITDLLASQSIGTGTKLTISLWLNCDSYDVRMPFSTGQTGNDRIYYWTENSKNTWRVGNYTSTTNHSTLPSVGTWFNTALVIDDTNVTGYLNGEEDYTGSYTGFTTANYATFGRHGASSSYYFDGKIAVAKIYNKALTTAEVLQNFKAYKNRFNI